MGRNRGLGLFRGNCGAAEKKRKRIMNDGESFVALFFGFLGRFFFLLFAKHFFLLYKNENDGDDDDGGVLVCVHVK